MRKWIASAVTVLVVSGAAGALGAESSKPYIGSWKARMTSAQLVDLGFVDPRAVGVWRLVLNRDGTYRAYNPLDRWTSGEFTASGRFITFKKDPACLDAGFRGAGLYRWSINEQKLKLTSRFVGSDPCGGRWQTLTYPLWTRG